MSKGTFLPILAAVLIGLLIYVMIQRPEEQLKGEKQPLSKEDVLLWAKARNSFLPITSPDGSQESDVEKAKVELGQMLYFDTRLSINNEQSCNTCHDLANYGVDNNPTSPGALPGTKGDRNSPTVFNAVLHDSQFWDGRAATLEEQAKGPILNPVEMAIPHEGVLVDRLKDVIEYVEKFSKAFPGQENPVTYDNVAYAIGAFERKLVTPSRFDGFMDRDFELLNSQEKRGLKVFLDANCQSCHDGPALGGVQYRRFGEFNDFRKINNKIKPDEGIYSLTGNPGDMFKFKVPGLRNIEKTYPYFHDGSIMDLGEAIQIMGLTQLNREFSQEELADLKAFMKTLTGDLPEELKNKPKLP